MPNEKKFQIRLVGKFSDISKKNWELIESMDKRIFRGCPRYEDPQNCYWWIVYWGKMPVGYAALDLKSCRSPKTSYLCRAGVLKAARGKGLQRKLILARIKMARKLNFKYMITCIHKDNPYSHNNVRSMKFKEYNPGKKKWGDPINAYLYMKYNL